MTSICALVSSFQGGFHPEQKEDPLSYETTQNERESRIQFAELTYRIAFPPFFGLLSRAFTPT